MPINVIESNKFYAWSTTIPFRSTKSGVGNGEEALLDELGGSLMGYSASWDITDKNGLKWEVKEPGSSGIIRLCTSGRLPAGKVMSIVEPMCQQLLHAISQYHEDFVLLMQRDLPFDIESFIDEDVPLLLRGEITKNRYSRLNEIASAIEKMKQDTKSFHHVTLDNFNFKVDSIIFAKIAAIIGSDDLYIDSKSGMLASLQHPAFDNGKIIENTWNSITPAIVFPDVDGVIVVSPDGFCPIVREKFDFSFVFNGISQAVPKFKYIGPSLKQTPCKS